MARRISTMHKNEAAEGFQILSDPNRVKIAKFLYVNNSLSYDDLLSIITDDKEELDSSLKMMEDGNLIRKDNDVYFINKDYVDSLMDFIRTPCGCCHH